jgi:tRNA (guanine37-N1)-methyltransferase
MVFDLVTIFPKMFDSYLEYGILKQALKKGLIEINFHDLRDMDKNPDDRPFGGGPGMILKAPPIIETLENIKSEKVVLLSPKGKLLDPKDYDDLGQLTLIAGRYEGVDERVKAFVDEEVSIGNYVLSGGELPAMVMMEAISRLLPGVLGHEDSNKDPGYAQYTQPREFKGMKVPEVLLSGDHKKIEEWRKEGN